MIFFCVPPLGLLIALLARAGKPLRISRGRVGARSWRGGSLEALAPAQKGELLVAPCAGQQIAKSGGRMSHQGGGGAAGGDKGGGKKRGVTGKGKRDTWKVMKGERSDLSPESLAQGAGRGTVMYHPL
jgi:hypothetical protein